MKYLFFFLVLCLMSPTVIGQNEVGQNASIRFETISNTALIRIENLNPAKDSTKNLKNSFGLKTFGGLFLGNVSAFYTRNIKQIKDYRLNIQTEIIYGYSLNRATYSLGIGISLNDLIKINNQFLVFGIGARYFAFPNVINSPNNSFYSSLGELTPKQEVDLLLRIGWQHHFNKSWGINLSYTPYLSFAEINRGIDLYNLNSKYKWRIYNQLPKSLLSFEFSVFKFF